MSYPPKTIYSDTLMSFGKYKGKSVAEICAIDPGYFVWLQEAGAAVLDDELAEFIDAWEEKNPSEAAKTRHAAAKSRKDKGEPAPTKPTSYKPPTREAASVTEPAASSNPLWGAWS